MRGMLEDESEQKRKEMLKQMQQENQLLVSLCAIHLYQIGQAEEI